MHFKNFTSFDIFTVRFMSDLNMLFIIWMKWDGAQAFNAYNNNSIKLHFVHTKRHFAVVSFRENSNEYIKQALRLFTYTQTEQIRNYLSKCDWTFHSRAHCSMGHHFLSCRLGVLFDKYYNYCLHNVHSLRFDFALRAQKSSEVYGLVCKMWPLAIIKSMRFVHKFHFRCGFLEYFFLLFYGVV